MLSIRKRVYRIAGGVALVLSVCFTSTLVVMQDMNFFDAVVSFLSVSGFVFAVVLFGARVFVQTLYQDIDALKKFLEALNQKDYSTPVEIQKHLEFLEFSLLLKNILKRLQKRKK